MSWQGIGLKPHDKDALASAFVVKAVLGCVTTTALIERITMDSLVSYLWFCDVEEVAT
ncbi:MAG: hypothetical protein K2P84_08550 [Undibacterium sp.]|nr:hypothetical protein [Undibacterium sp.]